jgi:quinol monooxygenase YgiN
VTDRLFHVSLLPHILLYLHIRRIHFENTHQSSNNSHMKARIGFLAFVFVIMTIACNQQAAAQAVKTESSAQAADYEKMITAKIFIKPGREADFISAAKTMINNVKAEEGCLSYMLYQDPYEKTNFIFIEKYKNQAAIDFHFGTTYFKEFGEKIADMTSKPSEIKILDIAGEK